MSQGATKAVWMHMLKNGGRWSCSELSRAIVGVSLHSVEIAVGAMSERGFIKRYERRSHSDRITFGVTKDCKVPNGVQLCELMAAGVLKEEAA